MKRYIKCDASSSEIQQYAEELSEYIDETGKDWWSAKDIRDLFLERDGIKLSLEDIMAIWKACPNPVCACELIR